MELCWPHSAWKQGAGLALVLTRAGGCNSQRSSLLYGLGSSPPTVLLWEASGAQQKQIPLHPQHPVSNFWSFSWGSLDPKVRPLAMYGGGWVLIHENFALIQLIGRMHADSNAEVGSSSQRLLCVGSKLMRCAAPSWMNWAQAEKIKPLSKVCIFPNNERSKRGASYISFIQPHILFCKVCCY